MRIALGGILVVAALAAVALGAPEVRAQPAVTVRQGDFERTILPLVREGSAEAFYSYSAADFNAGTFLEVPGRSLLFFYREASSGKLALVALHNAPGAGPGGSARFEIEGLPSEATLALRDDPDDSYAVDPPSVGAAWRWAPGHTDGLVVTDLPQTFSFTIAPAFEAGISRWGLLSQSSHSESVVRVPLPSLSEPLTLSNLSPGQPSPEGPTRAVRAVSTPQARPGSRFRVAIQLTVGVASHGLGVEEQLPLGFSVRPVESDGAVFKFTESRAQWLFPTVMKAGETRRIVYEVQVPGPEELISALPAEFEIQGAVASVSPGYAVPIAGESGVEVVSCLDPPVALAHIEPQHGMVDLSGSETVSSEQLERALRLWQEGAPVPGTCGAELSTPDLERVMRYHLLEIPVDRPLPPPALDRQAVTVTRTIAAPFPHNRVYLGAEGGNLFRVELRVRARRTLAGLTLSERLPTRWRPEGRGPPQVVFKPETVEWALPEWIPAGEERRLVYQVTVPPDAEPGEVALSGEADLGLVPFLIPIGGERTVGVLACLPGPLAIAHLDVETGAITVGLDHRITREQVGVAFRLWLEDREVPGTCGRKLDLSTLQTVIGHMLTGRPVEAEGD